MDCSFMENYEWIHEAILYGAVPIVNKECMQSFSNFNMSSLPMLYIDFSTKDLSLDSLKMTYFHRLGISIFSSKYSFFIA